ncbi:MAG: hypothetical protein JWN03_896 [Nocardia sp.]|nr:hypothetical protein [Nocardia sp.]
MEAWFKGFMMERRAMPFQGRRRMTRRAVVWILRVRFRSTYSAMRVASNKPPGVEKQQRQQRPHLRAANRDRIAIGLPHFNGSEYPELHDRQYACSVGDGRAALQRVDPGQMHAGMTGVAGLGVGNVGWVRERGRHVGEITSELSGLWPKRHSSHESGCAAVRFGACPRHQRVRPVNSRLRLCADYSTAQHLIVTG